MGGGRVTKPGESQKRNKRGHRPYPKPLTPGEYESFMSAIPAENLRDRLIFLLMGKSGLRVSEVCKLSIDDINLSEHTIFIHEGKGGKDRVIPFSKEIGSLLQEYLAGDRARTGEGDNMTALIVRKYQNHYLPLSPKGDCIRHLCDRYGEIAGITRPTATWNKDDPKKTPKTVQKHINPHSFRHYFATEFVKRKGDLSTLQNILGHSDSKTTSVYISLTATDLKKEYDRIIDGHGKHEISASEESTPKIDEKLMQEFLAFVRSRK